MKRENPLAVLCANTGAAPRSRPVNYARVYLRCKAMLNAALNAPDRWTYSDLAIAPPKADEFDALDLYHQTTGGEAALDANTATTASARTGTRTTRRCHRRRNNSR